MRAKAPPEYLVQKALTMLDSPIEATKRYAHNWLTERGYGKPTITVHMGRPENETFDLGRLTQEQLDQLERIALVATPPEIIDVED